MILLQIFDSGDAFRSSRRCAAATCADASGEKLAGLSWMLASTA
jgi:hypothetical protein